MSAMSSPFTVPPGQNAPFAVSTSTDNTAWIIIITAWGLSFVLLFAAIKIFISWAISPRIGLDEGFLAASTVFAIIQSSIILAACADGLGKSIELVSLANLDKVQQIYYVSALLFIITLGLSKVSVAFLLLRLTASEHHRRAFLGLAAIIAAWTIASTFAVALQCNLSHPWILIQESCPGVFLRWQLICIFDILTELCLLGMTFFLVWGLQTSMENKTIVVAAFGMRLPMLAFISLRLVTFNEAGLTTNPTRLQDRFIMWTQIEMSYSVIAAIMPSLRQFMKTLSTNRGINPDFCYGYDTGSGGDSGDTTKISGIQLSNLRPEPEAEQYECNVWVPENGVSSQNSINIGSSGRADAVSVQSNDSQRLIIRRGLAWEVVSDK